MAGPFELRLNYRLHWFGLCRGIRSGQSRQPRRRIFRRCFGCRLGFVRIEGNFDRLLCRFCSRPAGGPDRKRDCLPPSSVQWIGAELRQAKRESASARSWPPKKKHSDREPPGLRFPTARAGIKIRQLRLRRTADLFDRSLRGKRSREGGRDFRRRRHRLRRAWERPRVGGGIFRDRSWRTCRFKGIGCGGFGDRPECRLDRFTSRASRPMLPVHIGVRQAKALPSAARFSLVGGCRPWKPLLAARRNSGRGTSLPLPAARPEIQFRPRPPAPRIAKGDCAWESFPDLRKIFNSH